MEALDRLAALLEVGLRSVAGCWPQLNLETYSLIDLLLGHNSVAN